MENIYSQGTAQWRKWLTFWINKLKSDGETFEARVSMLEEKQTLFIDYKGDVDPISPEIGFIWYEDSTNKLFAFNGVEFLEIPLSADSVYIDRTTNQQYTWSGTTLVTMSVPLTKSAIESLVYSPKLTIPVLDINLAVAEVFDKTLTVATSFTISNPILYKGFRIKLTGGSLNTDLFTGYTENWILNSLITDYIAGSTNWLDCEIREGNNIYLFWGE